MPAACDTGQHELTVTVQTDAYYWETSWVLQ
eukprot:COSAG04_NODE_31243_length_258_cov_0.440252_1_plen_30_part_10